MKAFVLAGSILTAGLVSALIAQQGREGPSNQPAQATEQNNTRSGADQGNARHGAAQQSATTGERAGRNQEHLAKMNPTQRYITECYRNNLFEIQLAKLVADKADKDNIKQFARTISEAHNRANEQLRELAQRKSIEVPRDLNEWQQAKLQHASRVPADELGPRYVFHQVGMHHTAILEERYLSGHAQDQDVKTLATRMIPDLQNHLRQAEQLSQQLVGGGTVTER